MGIFKPVSFWALIGAIASYLLQLSPIPGVFLMMMGGPLLTGLLIDVFFVALLIEALTGRMPRILAVVPLLAAGAYYAVLLQQTLAIHARDAELRAANPRPGSVTFDPAHMSLVDDAAYTIAHRYAVARAYKPDASQAEGHFVYLLVPRPQCDAIREDSQFRIRKTYGAGVGMAGHFRTICELQFPHRPSGKVLKIERTGDGRSLRDGQDSETTTEFRSDGVLNARFKVVTTSRLAWLPLFMAGCALSDGSSSWVCFRDFYRTRVTLGTGSFGSEETAPERIVLGLRDYTDHELDNFAGYPENEDLIARATGMAKEVQKEVFQTLEKALADKDTPLPDGMGRSLALEPERLTPHAKAMADQFDTVVRDNADVILKCAQAARPDMPADQFKGGAAWAHAVKYAGQEASFWACWKARPQHAGDGALLNSLAGGLAALPAKDFDPFASRLWDALHQVGPGGEYLPDNYPLLYIRSAAPDAAARLKDDYRANRFRPTKVKTFALAICRAGTADAETMAMLKSDFTNTRSPEDRQALAVTLLKLGEKDFVRANGQALRREDQPWLQMLLDGKGWNKVGPNNCMPIDGLNWGSFTPAVMRPILVNDIRDGWIVRR